MNVSNRISEINLHVNSYSFVLNFKYGNFDVMDLLDFAGQEGLSGIDINIHYGGGNNLKNKSKKEFEAIRRRAEKLGLAIDLDVSSTFRGDIDQVMDVAKKLGAKRIRLYIRYQGRVSQLIKRAIRDLRMAAKLAEANDLYFFLEQHEDLKSEELIKVIKAVNSRRVSLLFDFGNMINANEHPMGALKKSLPYIGKVHLKDVRRVRKSKGYSQVGVPQGEGDIPQTKMLKKLLLLGESEPQVRVYSLQQVYGYNSVPLRFTGEDKDPMIPLREPSDTLLDETMDLKDNLSLEVKNVRQQIKYIRECFGAIKKETNETSQKPCGCLSRTV